MANPTGINQYTKGGAYATKSTLTGKVFERFHTAKAAKIAKERAWKSASVDLYTAKLGPKTGKRMVFRKRK